MNHADNCTLITQYYWQLPWQHVTSVFSACSTLECRNTGVWTTTLDNPSFCHRNPCHEIRKWLISTQHVPISIYISCHLYMREVVQVQSIDMTQQEVSLNWQILLLAGSPNFSFALFFLMLETKLKIVTGVKCETMFSLLNTFLRHTNDYNCKCLANKCTTERTPLKFLKNLTTFLINIEDGCYTPKIVTWQKNNHFVKVLCKH